MVNRPRLLSSVSSFWPGATSSSTTLAPGLPTVIGSSTDLPTGTSMRRTTSPFTDRVTGAVPPAGSSILNLAVTSRPTTPKRGACSITISRSRSFFLPAIRAWTGAPPSSGGRFLLESIAGTSCTWPSVRRTTPASRSGGTSTRAERMVSIRRVPPGRSLPSWMCEGGSTASRTSRPSCWVSFLFSASRAACTWVRRSPIAMESELSTTTSATSAIGLRCSSISEGLASASSTTASVPSRQKVPRARAARLSTISTTPIAPRPARISQLSSGSKATETAEVGFIAGASA